MKPLKSFSGFASWLMRIAVLLIVFAAFFNTFMAFGIKELSFYIAAGFMVFGLLLFIGGFVSKPTLTVVSGLILFLLSGLKAYWAFNGITAEFAQWVLMGSVALSFLANGNKN